MPLPSLRIVFPNLFKSDISVGNQGTSGVPHIMTFYDMVSRCAIAFYTFESFFVP